MQAILGNFSLFLVILLSLISGVLGFIVSLLLLWKIQCLAVVVLVVMIFGYMYGVYCTENVADDNTSSGEEELEVRLRWLVFLSTAEHLTYQPQHISLTHIQLSLCVQISDSNKFIGTCTYYINSSQFLANSPTIWPILSQILTK